MTLAYDQPPAQPQPLSRKPGEEDWTQQFERNLLLTVQACWRLHEAVAALQRALNGEPE